MDNNIIYRVTPFSKTEYQFNFNDIIMGITTPDDERLPEEADPTATRTFCSAKIPENIKSEFNHLYAHTALKNLVRNYATLIQDAASDSEEAIEKYYKHFTIPKKTGGRRQIDAPVGDLKEFSYEFIKILGEYFSVLTHTSAYAYIPRRCTLDAVKKHQKNESQWFLKTDFSSFFNNTSEDFIINQLSRVYPYNLILNTPLTAIHRMTGEDFRKCIHTLCYKGGLVQGNPASCLLTNLVMIPIDHQISRVLRDFGGFNFIYTRYADDCCISCKYQFNPQVVIDQMKQVLGWFEAPYELKPEKTKFGSRNGSNWWLGVLYNKDGNITLGRDTKKKLHAKLSSYCLDKLHGTPWGLHNVNVLSGQLSYYRSIEPEYVQKCIDWNTEKYGIDVMEAIRQDIAGNTNIPL